MPDRASERWAREHDCVRATVREVEQRALLDVCDDLAVARCFSLLALPLLATGCLVQDDLDLRNEARQSVQLLALVVLPGGLEDRLETIRLRADSVDRGDARAVGECVDVVADVSVRRWEDDAATILVGLDGEKSLPQTDGNWPIGS